MTAEDEVGTLWFSERHRRSIEAVDRSACPTVCKHFRADDALDELEAAARGIGRALAICAEEIDNPHFI